MTKKLSDKDKDNLVKELSTKTGFNIRRCKTFFEKFSWDKEKTYEYPVVKSALQKDEVSLFDFETTDVSEPEKKKETKEKKPKKVKTITTKKSKKEETKNPPEKKTKEKKNITPTKKRTNGGIDFQVDIVNGKEMFNGKEIHMDGSGFYHPYPTMHQIMKWSREFGPDSKKNGQ